MAPLRQHFETLGLIVASQILLAWLSTHMKGKRGALHQRGTHTLLLHCLWLLEPKVSDLRPVVSISKLPQGQNMSWLSLIKMAQNSMSVSLCTKYLTTFDNNPHRFPIKLLNPLRALRLLSETCERLAVLCSELVQIFLRLLSLRSSCNTATNLWCQTSQCLQRKCC